jgi:probable addiction module antidote protein
MSPSNETFARFDTANYLSTVEDVAAYLEAIIDEAEDDSTTIAQALGAIAQSRNFSEIARQAGTSRDVLYKAVSADCNPSLATVVKVAHTLGFRLRVEAIA